MVLFNTGSSGVQVDDNLRRLGLGDRRREVLPANTPALGQTFLRAPENIGALAALFGSRLQQDGSPFLANVLQRHLGDVVARYKAAVALNPQLQPDEFLAQLDLERFADNYSPYERGERPNAFSRGFKLLGG